MLMASRQGLIGVLGVHWWCLLGIGKSLWLFSSVFNESFVIVDSFECAESECLSLSLDYGCLSNVNEREGVFSIEIDWVVTLRGWKLQDCLVCICPCRSSLSTLSYSELNPTRFCRSYSILQVESAQFHLDPFKSLARMEREWTRWSRSSWKSRAMTMYPIQSFRNTSFNPAKFRSSCIQSLSRENWLCNSFFLTPWLCNYFALRHIQLSCLDWLFHKKITSLPLLWVVAAFGYVIIEWKRKEIKLRGGLSQTRFWNAILVKKGEISNFIKDISSVTDCG